MCFNLFLTNNIRWQNKVQFSAIFQTFCSNCLPSFPLETLIECCTFGLNNLYRRYSFFVHYILQYFVAKLKFSVFNKNMKPVWNISNRNTQVSEVLFLSKLKYLWIHVLIKTGHANCSRSSGVSTVGVQWNLLWNLNKFWVWFSAVFIRNNDFLLPSLKQNCKNLVPFLFNSQFKWDCLL